MKVSILEESESFYISVGSKSGEVFNLQICWDLNLRWQKIVSIMDPALIKHSRHSQDFNQAAVKKCLSLDPVALAQDVVFFIESRELVKFSKDSCMEELSEMLRFVEDCVRELAIQRYRVLKHELVGVPHLSPSAFRTIKSQENRRQTGYIYLVRSDDGYHKIGKSAEPNKRLKAISVSYPHRLSLIHLIATTHMSRAEVFLHKKFAQRWLKGEWFRLEDEDIRWICSLEKLEAGEDF